jgi:hypothetical protein
MSLNSAISVILPDRKGHKAHITSNANGTTNDYDSYIRSDGKIHGGIDINYVGGQGNPVNREHPPVFSPTAGTATAILPKWGAVLITDAKGYEHGLFHLASIAVGVGQTVSVGQQVGTMGKTGASAYHVHYQIKQGGKTVDPEKVWSGEHSELDVSPPEEQVDERGNVEKPAGRQPPPTPTIPIYPRQASDANDSGADKALWTNRVPEHEPWPRVLKCQPQKDRTATQKYDDDAGMMYQDADIPQRQDLNRHHDNEFADMSAWVGRAEGNEEIKRNPLWRR